MNPNLPSAIITAILAGGKARRFDGQDKGEILIHGRRLIDIIHERLKSQSHEILISGQHDYGLGLSVIPDTEDAPDGPAGGIYSIWKHIKEGSAEGFFTVPIDGPELPYDLIARLYSKDTSSIAVDDAGQHPTYSWWRMEDLSRIWKNTDRSNSLSLKYLAELVGAGPAVWTGDAAFININRAADLEQFVKGA